MKDQLEEFKSFYSAQIEKEAPIYAKKASELFTNTAFTKNSKS